jgi:hypothetical protein
MTQRRQPYFCGMLYPVVAEATGISMSDLFLSPERIVWAYRRLREVLSPALQEAIRADIAVPHLAGFSYHHVAALGAVVDFPPDGEPKPRTLLETPDDVRKLREPDDWLESGLIPRWREMTAEIARLWGEGASDRLGVMGAEGPVTSAVLLAGPQFFTWAYDCPEVAHDLMDFVTRSGVRFAQATFAAAGADWPPQTWGVADDFGGMFSPRMFEEFVIPYWNLEYELVGAETRVIHTELIKPAHLPLLAQVGLQNFDPGADLDLTPEDLKAGCPVPFNLRICAWHMRDLNAAQLCDMYRHFASFEPAAIQFGIEELAVEAKFLALLEVAREMDGEG